MVSKKGTGPVLPSILEGMHQIVLCESNGPRNTVTVRCGRQVVYDRSKGTATEAGATVWHSDVTCPDCLKGQV